jgi:hypothetical protein
MKLSMKLTSLRRKKSGKEMRETEHDESLAEHQKVHNESLFIVV